MSTDSQQSNFKNHIVVHSIRDIVSLGKLSEYKTELGGTKIVLVRLKGYEDIHTLSLPILFSSCGRLCNIGNQPWFDSTISHAGRSEWLLTDDVEVVDVIPNPKFGRPPGGL